MQDDAATELRQEQGGQANANDFDRYNTDGASMGNTLGSQTSCLARRHRVLIEIAERRRMRALTELENGKGRRLLDLADEFHRKLAHETNAYAINDMMSTPVLGEAEIQNMFDGDEQRAQEMARSCQKENDEIQKKMVTYERRLLKSLDLTADERRELSHESDSCGAGTTATGTVSPSPDPLDGAMCTPCQTAGYLSEAFADTAMSRPLNAQAFEMGRPNWCVEDLNNFRAVAADQPELLTAYGPIPPEDYYDTFDAGTNATYPEPGAR